MNIYGTIVRNDLRILKSDPVFAVTFLIMPLVMMVVLKGVSRAALVQAGHAGANGAEQAVSGSAVLFAFFLVGNVGFGVFREHGWNTWSRLRASPASAGVLLAGKATVPLLLLATQMVVLFAVGLTVVGLHVRGSWAGLVLVLAAFGVCLGALGFALLAICRTVQQLNAFANLGALVLGAVGGALAPIQTLPGWVQAAAHVTPTYWAMRGLFAVTLDNEGLSDVLPSVAVLLAFAAAFALVAVRRLSVSEVKVSWA